MQHEEFASGLPRVTACWSFLAFLVGAPPRARASLIEAIPLRAPIGVARRSPDRGLGQLNLLQSGLPRVLYRFTTSWAYPHTRCEVDELIHLPRPQVGESHLVDAVHALGVTTVEDFLAMLNRDLNCKSMQAPTSMHTL